MTMPELALSAVMIVGALMLVAGLYEHYLNRAKVRQVSNLIEGLSQAAAVYRETTGAYPPGRWGDTCGPALAGLQMVSASAAQLDKLGSSLLFLADGKLRCIDPWGQPLRYLTDRSAGPERRRRVQDNGEVPIFESAGPDRDFGDADTSRQADNICSDDPDYSVLLTTRRSVPRP